MRLAAVLLLVLPLAVLAHDEAAAPAIEPGSARLQVSVSGTIQLQ
ncbi:MAG: hypothetical protein WD886_03460 [Burkholderiales bacterium]